MLRNQVKNPAASGNAVLMLRGFFLRKKPGVESMTVHIRQPFIRAANFGPSWLFPVKSQRGQALFQTALFLPLLVVILGLVVDGGLLFANYRRAQIAADTAAHAASHQISIEVFVESNQVVLAAPAFDKALRYGTHNSHGNLAIRTVSILNQGRLVRVTGEAALPTCFLRLVGISSLSVPVVGEAYPAYGIEQEWQ